MNKVIPALDQVTKNEEQTGNYEPVENYISIQKDGGEEKQHEFVQKTITNKLGQKKTIFVKQEKKEIKS